LEVEAPLNMHVKSVTIAKLHLLRSPLKDEAPLNIRRHVVNLCSVPLAEVTVEGQGMHKHANHVSDIATFNLLMSPLTDEAP
jgi:hypothetical protein